MQVPWTGKCGLRKVRTPSGASTCIGVPFGAVNSIVCVRVGCEEE